jgi:hypothetical protein
MPRSWPPSNVVWTFRLPPETIAVDCPPFLNITSSSNVLCRGSAACVSALVSECSDCWKLPHFSKTG